MAKNLDPAHLKAELQRELNRTLWQAIVALDEKFVDRLDPIDPKISPPLDSLADLLHHPSAPIPLLNQIKEASKRCRKLKTGTVPGPVAEAIYYASIAAALVHRDEIISTLESVELREKFQRTSALPWLDDRTRSLMDEALACMGTTPPPQDQLVRSATREEPESVAAPDSGGVEMRSRLTPHEREAEEEREQVQQQPRQQQPEPEEEPPPPPMAPPRPMSEPLIEVEPEPEEAAPVPAMKKMQDIAPPRFSWTMKIGVGALVLVLISYLAWQNWPETAPPPLPGDKSTHAGVLDYANGQEIRGWAMELADPDKSVRVEIRDGVNPPASVVAEEFRSDLLEKGMGNGKHGFTYPTPDNLKDGQPHEIRVRVAGTDFQLTNTPYPLVLPEKPPQ